MDYRQPELALSRGLSQQNQQGPHDKAKPEPLELWGNLDSYFALQWSQSL